MKDRGAAPVRRRIAVRLVFVAAAVALALLSLEVAVRVVLAFDRNYLDEAFVRPRAPEGRELTLLDLIRPHPDDRVVFELRPGVKGTFYGHEVEINSLGMRDVERSYEKPPGTFRVVGLGDSHTFGWGVAREETFLAVLERMLAERFPGRRFEVWNLGVPGYNTVMEVRAFELRLDALDPDLVVINYVVNDMDLPNFLAERPSLVSLRKSYLAELVGRRLAVLDDAQILPPGLVGVAADERTGRYLADPERVPERYRGLAGWENMEAAFRHLAGLGRARGFRVVLLFNPDDYRLRLSGRTTDVRRRGERELAERLRREGYLVVDAQNRIMRYLQETGADQSTLWIRPTDSHTNPLRHRLVAEVLLKKLLKTGALAGDDPS